MAGRGSCPGRSKPGTSRPALTRTQMLRAAQTSAVVQQRDAAEAGPSQPRPGPSHARQALSRPPPKKIDFAAPQMTKALQMRQKAAADKIKAMELEKQKAAAAARRRPRRTPAPVGGDARLGRCPRAAPSTAPRTAPPKTPEAQLRVLENAIAKGAEAAERERERASAAVDAAITRGHIVTERSGAIPKRRIPGPSGLRPPRPRAAGTPIPEDTRELARLMNADIVQAMPISEGPVNKIIIDPGAVKPDRSTIVCIPPTSGDSSQEGAVGGIANKSLQAISETLDEQDAVESAAVQSKLEELQNARREFVIAVANVSGNAVNVADESGESILNIDDVPEQLEYLPSPPRERAVYSVPDVSHVMFQVEYGRDHPDVEAARKFSRRTQMTLDELQSQKRVEAEFERVATQQMADFDLGVPLEQQLQEGDISLEEDEFGTILACPSRIKASMRIPRRSEAAPSQRGANIEEIERFFDIENYPPEQSPCPRAPPGREGLHPDLWSVDDPWYHERVYDEPPLIQFDSNC